MKNIALEGGRGLVVDEGRKGDWMQTYTGRRFYPADPRAADVDILDIALALGNMTRYGGHCRFYSVAEHSVLVSHIVPPQFALEGLLHDATEAYVADLIRPMKRCLAKDNEYFKIDALVRLAIAEKFRLQPKEPREVIEADCAILATEKEVLHPRSDPWDIPFANPGLKIRCLIPPASQRAFLVRYAELTQQHPVPLLEELDAIFSNDERVLHEHWGVK